MKFKTYDEFIFEGISPEKLIEGLAYTFKGKNAIGPDSFDIRYIMKTNLQYQFRVIDKNVAKSSLHLTEEKVQDNVYEKEWPHHMWSTYEDVSDTFTEQFDQNLEEFFKLAKIDKKDVILIDKEKLIKEKNGDITLFDILDKMKKEFVLQSRYYNKKSGEPWNRGMVLRNSLSYFSKPFFCIMQEERWTIVNQEKDFATAFFLPLEIAEQIVHKQRGSIEGKKFSV